MSKTSIDPIVQLRARVQLSTIQAVAEEIGVSGPYLSSILAGTRPASDKVLEFLGLERVVTVEYRRIAS